MKSTILFYLIKMFVSLPLSDNFSPLRRLKVSARYASFPSQILLETNKAKSVLCSCKKNTSSRSSNRHSTTFLWESHRTSVCSKSLSAHPSSLQSCEKQSRLKWASFD